MSYVKAQTAPREVGDGEEKKDKLKYIHTYVKDEKGRQVKNHV